MIVAGDLKQIQISSYVIPFWARASSNSILQRRKMKCDFPSEKVKIKFLFLKTTLSKKKKKPHFLISLPYFFYKWRGLFQVGWERGVHSGISQKAKRSTFCTGYFIKEKNADYGLTECIYLINGHY